MPESLVDKPRIPASVHNSGMTMEELEAQALKLDPKGRARLAGKLLESLEELSEEENAQLWAEEAKRRDAYLDRHPGSARSADEVLREVRSRLK